MFRYWSILSLFSFSDAWSLSCTNSKDFREDFPLFVLVAGELRIGLFPSGVSSKRLFAEVDFGGVTAVNAVIYLVTIPGQMNTVIQDFESFEHKDYKRDLNACHALLLQIQLSEGFELKFHPRSPSFWTD